MVREDLGQTIKVGGKRTRTELSVFLDVAGGDYRRLPRRDTGSVYLSIFTDTRED